MKIEDIKLIVLDVDGTLTDGCIYLDSFGNELKAFNVKDGLGIKNAIKKGIEVAIITGRKSEIVNKRAAELCIKYVFQNIVDKVEQLELLTRNLEIDYSNVAFIGDDINDLECMKLVGFSACPIDAIFEIKENVNFISKYEGGKGAVREIIDYLIK